MGVRRGMIRSEEECLAGLNAIKRRYLNTSRDSKTGEIPLLVLHPILFLCFLPRLFKLRLSVCLGADHFASVGGRGGVE